MARQTVRVNFTVPAAVALADREINEQTKAAFAVTRMRMRVLPVMVTSHSLNGRVYLSTNGHRLVRTQLRTACRQLKAQLQVPGVPESIEMSTADGRTVLDLLRILGAKLETERLSGEAPSDLPLLLPEMMQRSMVVKADAEDSH